VNALRPTLACALMLSVIGFGSGVEAGQAATEHRLTGETELLRVYGAIFDARFDAVPQLLQRSCPPAPSEACQVLDVVALWWQIQLDPASPARDGQFQSKVDAAVAAMEAWTRREPERAEAWFYLGGAYGARAQWRVLRGQRLAAARPATARRA